MRRRWIAWSVSVLVVGTGTLGCRGALEGPLAFPVVDQKALWGTQFDGGLDATRLQLVLVDSDRLPYCVRGQLPAFKAVLLAITGGGQPVVPGTYRVLGSGSSGTEPSSAFGLLESPDGGEGQIVALAVDGGVTLTACAGTRCAGTFEGLLLRVDDGGTSGLSGAFDALALVCN